MGVIKKSDPKLGKFADSEESLHIVQYSEDDDGASTSSEISVASLPILHHRHNRTIPVPMSFTNERKPIGKKRCRRFDNVHQLETLVEDEELQAITIHDFIPHANVGFSKVVESGEAMEVWESFVNSSEEVQQQITESQKDIPCKKMSCSIPQTPEEAFRNIKAGLRNTLKKSHVPLGIIEHLETKIVEFFNASPADIFISDHLNSFERLLLHAVAQYYCLRSLSFDSESDNVRLVKVSNPRKWFHQPAMLLVKYLDERKKKLSLH